MPNYLDLLTPSHGDFISPDPNKVKFEQIERPILGEIQKTTKSTFGIEVELCGIKQLGLTETVTAEAYSKLQQDPELAKFLFELRALETSLKERSTIIADPNTPPFDLLRSSTGKTPGASTSR